MAYKSTVRAAMLLEHQAPEAHGKIHQAIIDGLAKYRSNEGYRLAWPAILASAQKA
jgi:hypothetical protein